MKRRLFGLVIVLSLCLGLTACRESNVAADISTEDMKNEMETAVESTVAPSQEETEASTEEPETESTEEPVTEEQPTTTPETEEPTTEAAGILGHTKYTQVAGDGVVQPFDLGTTVLVDLDGDGVDEQLMVIMEELPTPWSYPSVLINEHYFTRKEVNGLYAEMPYRDYFYLMDLDVTDQWIEIALREAGPSGDPKTTFFRYHDGEMICIGSVPNVLWIKEDGTMSSTVLGDGKYTGKARLDIIQTDGAEKTWGLVNGAEFNASIEEVIPEFYEFSILSDLEYWCSIRQELPVYKEMIADADQMIILPVGTKIEFRRYYPIDGWIELISTEKETLGWIKLEGDESSQMIMPINVERWSLRGYVDGLNFAD